MVSSELAMPVNGIDLFQVKRKQLASLNMFPEKKSWLKYALFG
jgi:hypothetical protein